MRCLRAGSARRPHRRAAGRAQAAGPDSGAAATRPPLLASSAPAAAVANRALDLSVLGPRNRRHPALEEGANANFVKVLAPSRLLVRTWERGVEAETLACGSGAVASAVVTSFLTGGRPPVSVATRSGETLEVSFVRDGELARDLTLTGDARVVFEGTLKEDPGPGPC